MQLYQIIEDMKKTEQTSGQSVYDHGTSVRNHLMVLINYLRNNTVLNDWRLPEWMPNYRKQLLAALLPIETLQTYALYHDCGKPYCLSIDEQGRKHFPNHAQVSHDTWLESGGDPQVAELILHDMDVHTIKAVDVNDFCERKEAISLLLTGLSEIHSNAKMFGEISGIHSVSFKIKWKQIEKRGKQICKRLFDGI